MSDVIVFDIQKFSIHDGPGIRTVVFLKGCTVNCLWCANPEGKKNKSELMYYPDKCIGCKRCVEVCPTQATKIIHDKMIFDRNLCEGCGKCAEVCYSNARRMSGREYSADELFEEIMKDVAFYRQSGGGVTFSGGEAMLFPEFINEVAARCKENGISVAVETAGNVPWSHFGTILESVDYFLYDLKIMNPEKHRKYCGCLNNNIKSNLEKLSSVKSRFNFEIIIRMPIIPGINDDIDEMTKKLEYVCALGNVKEVHLLPYHNLGVSKYAALGQAYLFKDLVAPSDEKMKTLCELFASKGIPAQIGG